MLKRLEFRHVGPADHLQLELKPRLNLLTGDNGLGKSFLLDAAWWALTRTWVHRPLMPHRPPASASITYTFDATKGEKTHTSTFDRRAESWSSPLGRPAIPGLVLYAHVDGGFSVWDPARNYWRNRDVPDRPASFLFGPEDVWRGTDHCEGVYRDWKSWQLEDGETFNQLKRVLKALSPSSTEVLQPGALQRISIDDPLDYPTLALPYGADVPLPHASAAMRRIVALAYLLVWSWREHNEAARLVGLDPAQQIIFLVDEIESHLHPRWQRRIVPALLDVMQTLTGPVPVEVQLITATHSPMVLLSVESRFDQAKDALWELDLVDDAVRLSQPAFHRRGTANAWLTSSVFDLEEARSLEAEEAMRQSLAYLMGTDRDPDVIDAITDKLRKALGELDPFWVRWGAFCSEQGATTP